MVLLDVLGQNHDEELWGDPHAFRPKRFLERAVDPDELIPHSGGEPNTGHRCPGRGSPSGCSKPSRSVWPASASPSPTRTSGSPCGGSPPGYAAASPYGPCVCRVSAR
ncbi:cytochrome P450 [Streptomyces sp. NBC_00287]|uniref:cytochrome P450 n=1 Tax=Streptomyces sp. NBC_00287 TaxID=2975702 RepID=UPI003FA780E9